MKWCFLLNQIDSLIEFLGKLSYQIIENGDECIIVANSKISEYSKGKYFSPNVRFFSKVDWCIENYKKNLKTFNDISWREFFPTFDRELKYSRLNYNYAVELVSQLYQFADYVVGAEKPDVVINEVPANLFTEIFYNFCKRYNIVYLGIIDSKFGGQRIDSYDLKYTCSKYEKAFNEITDANITEEEKRFAQDFVKKFISHQQFPSFWQYDRTHSGLVFRVKDFIQREKELIAPFLKYLRLRRKFRDFDYESEVVLKWHLWWHFWKGLKRRIKSFLQRNIYDLPKNDEKFFLFPLHYEPEAGISVWATYFSYQLSTVKNIAFALPFPYKLYVKEHPAMEGSRSWSFYRELKKIPNLVLVSPSENAEKLIRESQAVITLTGTMGMEAALAGKPVYVLGNIFYSYHPLCKKLNGFEELKQAIEADLKNPFVIRDLESVNNRFILSYFRNTIPGDILTASTGKDINNYNLIYENIKKIFFEKKNGGVEIL